MSVAQSQTSHFQEAKLHHDVIVSNAWALFFAGYESTSTALAYASYLLAKYPRVSSA